MLLLLPGFFFRCEEEEDAPRYVGPSSSGAAGISEGDTEGGSDMELLALLPMLGGRGGEKPASSLPEDGGRAAAAEDDERRLPPPPPPPLLLLAPPTAFSSAGGGAPSPSTNPPAEYRRDAAVAPDADAGSSVPCNSAFTLARSAAALFSAAASRSRAAFSTSSSKGLRFAQLLMSDRTRGIFGTRSSSPTESRLSSPARGSTPSSIRTTKADAAARKGFGVPSPSDASAIAIDCMQISCVR